MRTWQTLGRTSSAGGQGKGKDSELGFAPAASAGSPGVQDLAGWLAGGKELLREKGATGLKQGKQLRLPREGEEGPLGHFLLPPPMPTGNVGAPVNSSGDASVPPLPLA